jgi:hypothetical protein
MFLLHLSLSTRFCLPIAFVLTGKENTKNPPYYFTFCKYSAFGKSLCTYKRCLKCYLRTTVSKNWIKQLHSLPVLQFNLCLTTEYSKTTAHFNGNFDTDNQIYVPYPKCTVTFRTHCIWTKVKFFFLRHVTVRHFSAQMQMALVSLPPHKFARSLCCYQWLWVVMNYVVGCASVA